MLLCTYDFFQYDVYKILLIIFPEIKFFIEGLDCGYKFASTYKRYHLLISWLIFKYSFLLTTLKKEIKNNDNFLITDSNEFNLFVLETRCMFCIFGIELFPTSECYKIAYLKAFISFIRLKNPIIMPYFLVNEYVDIADLLPLTHLIDFDLRLYFNKKITDATRNMLNTLHVKNIKEPLFYFTNESLDEKKKLELYYSLFSDPKIEKEAFMKRNQDLPKKITHVFKELFKS